MLLNDFLGALGQAGQNISEGAFTISPREARRKLSEFQHQDPHRYILLLISAAIEGGASYIEISDSRKSLTMAFDGRAYTRDQFEKLYQDIFGGKLDEATKLGLGLAGVPEGAEVVSISPNGTATWKLGKDLDEANQSNATGPPRTIITIAKPKQPWSFLLSLRGYAGFSPEARLVDLLCEHSRIPISINGQPVNRPIQLGKTLVAMVSRDTECAFVARLTHHPRDSRAACALALGQGPLQVVIHGVSFPLQLRCGLRGVIWSNALTTDLSVREVVRNRSFEELHHFLDELRCEAVRDAAKHLHLLSVEEVIQLAEQLCQWAGESGLPSGLSAEALFRIVEFLTRSSEHRRLRAQLLVQIAHWYVERGDTARASSLYVDAYYFLKEALRLDGLDLSVLSATVSALAGTGADNTTLCDWVLLGAATALNHGQLEAAKAWYARVLEMASLVERDSRELSAAALLGLAECEDEVMRGFEQARDLGLELAELQLIFQRQPRSFRPALIMYQRQLACRYREDIHHILVTRGLLEPEQ